MAVSAPPAPLLPTVGFAAARPAARAVARAVASSPGPRSLRPARAHYVVLAVRTPPRSVSVRCSAPRIDSFVGGAPAPSRKIHRPALNALKRAAADAFRPLLDNFNHLRSLKKITDVNDYNIGMPFGVVVASLGCYQLFKIAPWAFLDLALGYLFYKLSVVSSQVHRQGFANDLITMIQVAIVVVMVIKPYHCNFDALGFLRMPVLHLYFSTFYCSVKGWKEDAKYDLTKFFEMLQAQF